MGITKKSISEILSEGNEILTSDTNLLTTGIKSLDKLINGISTSDLVIISGRPGMGKQELLLSLIADQVSSNNKKILFVSGRDNRLLMAQKLNKMSSGDSLLKGSLWIEDEVQDFTEIFEIALELKNDNGLDAIAIDGLELIDHHKKKKGKEREKRIIRSLKEFSLKHHIPILFTVNASREVDWRGGDKRPVLSDLYGSSALEQTADKVLFVYRPEYYGFSEDEEGKSVKGIAEIIVAKNRHGSLGLARTKFNDKTGLFSN